MATTNVTIANSGWTDCGAGPLALVLSGVNSPIDVLVYSAAAAPGVDSDAARVNIEPLIPFNYQFTAKLFVKLAAGGGASSVAAKVIA